MSFFERTNNLADIQKMKTREGPRRKLVVSNKEGIRNLGIIISEKNWRATSVTRDWRVTH